MNFLSHYYFEKATDNEHMVMGVVLPDLVKNASKDWNLYPQKNDMLFLGDNDLAALLAGWKKHLEVDRLFHSSLFFASQTSVLRQMIVPVLQSGPVKPFFLAHIGLELLIDHLLVVHQEIDIASFYEQLSRANSPSLRLFLDKAGLEDPDRFFKFLDGFISSRYLLSYQKIENITYALNRICMRIWPNPFTEAQLEHLTEQFTLFSTVLNRDYLTIFKEIEMGLTT
jgi:acyl carrier protein phosphodiesterase